jgi:hypothetical protein
MKFHILMAHNAMGQVVSTQEIYIYIFAAVDTASLQQAAAKQLATSLLMTLVTKVMGHFYYYYCCCC